MMAVVFRLTYASLVHSVRLFLRQKFTRKHAPYKASTMDLRVG